MTTLATPMAQNSDYHSMATEARTRRHSCPMSPKEIEADFEDDITEKSKRSASLEASPMIRLGSKTAKQAAKSFWNMDMFQESLEKIAQYAAIESSSLGSSIETVSADEEPEDNLLTISTEECTCLLPIAPHLMDLPFSLTPRSAPSTPLQSPQLPLKRSKSACAERRTSAEKKKASMIPRKISPAAYSPAYVAKVRFQVTNSQIMPMTEKTCSYTINTHDDGYHEV